MLVIIAMWLSFFAGAFYRITDRALHAKNGPDQSVRSVLGFFRRESAWFLARLMIAALIFLSLTYEVALPLSIAVTFGISFGLGFETAVDSLQKHARNGKNGTPAAT